jgi:CRISPR-associated endonuclease/helicase Cas3
MLSLEHAVTKGMQRVIYVIPYTSIIEQTAQIFRDALMTGNDDVLEHHTSFDWDKASRDDHEGRGGIDKLRKAAENWDGPVEVTSTPNLPSSPQE